MRMSSISGKILDHIFNKVVGVNIAFDVKSQLDRIQNVLLFKKLAISSYPASNLCAIWERITLLFDGISWLCTAAQRARVQRNYRD